MKASRARQPDGDKTPMSTGFKRRRPVVERSAAESLISAPRNSGQALATRGAAPKPTAVERSGARRSTPPRLGLAAGQKSSPGCCVRPSGQCGSSQAGRWRANAHRGTSVSSCAPAHRPRRPSREPERNTRSSSGAGVVAGRLTRPDRQALNLVAGCQTLPASRTCGKLDASDAMDDLDAVPIRPQELACHERQQEGSAPRVEVRSGGPSSTGYSLAVPRSPGRRRASGPAAAWARAARWRLSSRVA
jgi:hypothetical protein